MVETITMTTVTERRILHEETNTTNSIVIAPTALAQQPSSKPVAGTVEVSSIAKTAATANTTIVSHLGDDMSGENKIPSNNFVVHENRNTYLNSNATDISLKPNSISAQITGILKGGKLRKSEHIQVSQMMIYM